MTYLEPVDTTALTLPGLTLHEVGAAIDGPIDRPAVYRALGALLGRESMTRWQIGDLLAALIDDDGGDAAPTLQGVHVELKQQYTQAWLTVSLVVAQRVPLQVRRPELSFGHHEAVSHLDPEVQAEWLAKAILHRWSVRDLVTNVEKDQGDAQGELPLPPTLPRPPASQLRQILEADPDAWVLWQPASGTLRPGAAA